MTVVELENKLRHLPRNMQVFMENEMCDEGLLDILSIKITEINMRHPDDEESQEPILEQVLILSDEF